MPKKLPYNYDNHFLLMAMNRKYRVEFRNLDTNRLLIQNGGHFLLELKGIFPGFFGKVW